MLVLLVVVLSLVPSPALLPATQGDKFMHLFAYAVLMSWFVNLYPVTTRQAGIAAGFIVLGIALEFIQRWTGYRTFDMADMAYRSWLKLCTIALKPNDEASKATLSRVVRHRP